jgi:alpha-tubulin suppressor-like RCC1 family protein
MEDYTEVFVWGSNEQGQLGLDSDQTVFTLPRFCSFRTLISSAACGDEHTLFLTKEHIVYSLGANSHGQLGLGHCLPQTEPQCVQALAQVRVIQLACGGAHSLVLSAEGAAYSWGRGDWGQLGLGSTESQELPRLMRTQPSYIVREISGGARHSALVVISADSKGLLLMCGAGEAGQLGTGRRERELLAVQAAELKEVKQVACGVVHTLCVTFAGAVFSMGANNLGQLGVPIKQSSTLPLRIKTLEGIFMEKVACGLHSAALSERGELYLWGSGTFGHFSTPCKVATLPVALQEISLAQGFGLGLDVNRKLWSWGSNTSGQLGLGDYQSRETPTPVAALQAKTVASVTCGGNFVLALGRETVDALPNYTPLEQSVEIQRPPGLEEENHALRQQVERLREDLEVTEATMHAQSEDAQGQTQDIEQELHQLREENTTLLEENEALEAQLKDTRQQLELQREETLSARRDLMSLQAAYDQLCRQNDSLLGQGAGLKSHLADLAEELEQHRDLPLNTPGASILTPELLSRARQYREYSSSVLQAVPETSRSGSPGISPRQTQSVQKGERTQLSPQDQRRLAASAQRFAGSGLADLKERLRQLNKRPTSN